MGQGLAQMFEKRAAKENLETFFSPQGTRRRWAVGPLGRWGRWAVGPLGRWAVGPLGRWAVGPLGRWAVGPLGRWAVGPLGRWAVGLSVIVLSLATPAAAQNGSWEVSYQASGSNSSSAFAYWSSGQTYSDSYSEPWPSDPVREGWPWADFAWGYDVSFPANAGSFQGYEGGTSPTHVKSESQGTVTVTMKWIPQQEDGETEAEALQRNPPPPVAYLKVDSMAEAGAAAFKLTNLSPYTQSYRGGQSVEVDNGFGDSDQSSSDYHRVSQGSNLMQKSTGGAQSVTFEIKLKAKGDSGTGDASYDLGAYAYTHLRARADNRSVKIVGIDGMDGDNWRKGADGKRELNKLNPDGSGMWDSVVTWHPARYEYNGAVFHPGYGSLSKELAAVAPNFPGIYESPAGHSTYDWDVQGSVSSYQSNVHQDPRRIKIEQDLGNGVGDYPHKLHYSRRGNRHQRLCYCRKPSSCLLAFALRKDGSGTRQKGVQIFGNAGSTQYERLSIRYST